MTSLHGGCRSFTTPVAPLRTLASLHSYFLHNHHTINAFSSNSRSFGCQFTKVVAALPSTCSSSNGYSQFGYDRLLPCPAYNDRAPRVEHLIVMEEGGVVDYISKLLELPPLFVADLIHFGAVHYALVSPKPPPTATPEQIRLFEEATSPLVLKKRASLKGKTIQEAQKTYRVTHADQFLEPGMYLRVYVHPRRFPRCYEIDWKSRIIAVTDSYVVLDKPAGTSVGGTTNNIEETCATFSTRALALATPLKTTHQLDNCTEGCVVLARTKEFCSDFQRKIREKEVTKLYLALSASPVPIGVITHYMRHVSIAPKLVSEEFTKGWYLCQLEVLECIAVRWPDAVTTEKYSVDDCGWPLQDYAYECKINLLTGRTHQIRAQLAACGAPIVGDSMYMPAAIAEIKNPGTNPFGKHKKQNSCADDESMWIEQHGKEPKVAIALQACQISWDDDDDGNQEYKAESPWWRRDV
ncbi:hypothetical protein M5689_002499 [Euphorbia peplus]|nr:hypothetical protein M5689_002499 [Euphorbia peplus]